MNKKKKVIGAELKKSLVTLTQALDKFREDNPKAKI